MKMGCTMKRSTRRVTWFDRWPFWPRYIVGMIVLYPIIFCYAVREAYRGFVFEFRDLHRDVQKSAHEMKARYHRD